MTRRQSLVVACCSVLFASSATGQDVTPLDSDVAQRYGKLLSDRAAQIEAPQVAIKADPSKAVGVGIGRDAIVVVPQKDLVENEPGDAYRTQTGAPLAYLFSTPTLKPVVDGKPVDNSKLRTVPLPGRDGAQLSTNCLLLSARRLSDEEWRLYVYGSDKMPLIDTQFTQASGDEKQTIALTIEKPQKQQGKLVLTLFGKYRAGFDVSYLGE